MNRRLVLVLAGAAGLVLLAGLLALQVLHVRADLRAALRLVGPAETAVRAGERPDLTSLTGRLHAAAAGSDGVLWQLAEHAPYLGTDLHAIRRSAQAVDELARHALPPLSDAAQTVRHGQLVSSGTVDLSVLARVHDDVRKALPWTTAAQRTVAALHGHVVGAQLAELKARVARLASAVSEADQALTQAPALLGAEGDRHYLLAMQNNAESRATGGLIGAVGEVVAHQGHLQLVRTLTNDELHSAPHPVPDDPQAARTWVAIGSTLAWFDSNLTPSVPDAGRNVAGLWQAQFGGHLDGVVFVDAVALQDLTRGPVSLPHGRMLSRDQVLDFICSTEYVDYPDDTRKPLLRALGAQVFHGATSGGSLQAFSDVASSGHLLAWLANPQEEALLLGHPIGGALPGGSSPYLQVITQNFAGDKLDYYLHRTVRVRREHDGLRISVELRNDAPLGLPDYVTTRADKPVPPVPYGQDLISLSVYAGRGARFSDAVVDGQPAGNQVDSDHGLPFTTIQLEVPRGRLVTFSVLLTGPVGELTYRQQPLVRPDVLDLGVPHRVVA